MRSSTAVILAAASAASAQQTSIPIFYPGSSSDLQDLNNIAVSVVSVQDASHTVVAFSCVDGTTTSSSAAPTSTDSDDLDDIEDGCVFAMGALTATVGPDSFNYVTAQSGSSDYSFDFTMAVGCTSADNKGTCTYSAGGADAWADYCQATVVDPSVSDYDAALTSCYDASTASSVPASTTTLAADEMTTWAVPVTAGADKLSAGASATTSKSASATGKTASGSGSSASATGSSSSASRTGSSTASGAAATESSSAAAARRGGAAFAGVVGGLVAMLL
ncbi:hypothetical protein SLS56_005529 [Neofusicoccum ribis]|uniref:Uncharacterized protein n=1 Tax=Neofusicoccum ribis TaxID=45134 RepID=A0ABR3STD4_9PEZI